MDQKKNSESMGQIQLNPSYTDKAIVKVFANMQ